jgi:two-component system nitrate/nitrite response regulator NarL
MQRAVVVDDSASLRLLTRLALEDADATEVVGEAADAREALELIDTLCPDVAIVDLHMPGMNGVELIEMLRTRGVKIRLVAYSSDETGLVEALRAGADAAVLKSPQCAGLLTALAS